MEMNQIFKCGEITYKYDEEEEEEKNVPNQHKMLSTAIRLYLVKSIFYFEAQRF